MTSVTFTTGWGPAVRAQGPTADVGADGDAAGLGVVDADGPGSAEPWACAGDGESDPNQAPGPPEATVNAAVASTAAADSPAVTSSSRRRDARPRCRPVLDAGVSPMLMSFLA
ncbi:hypothetical protein Cci01nite_12770 [Catellatospora citrea]|uniref:Uncharacterized protein n=1 Tax=Catellatospora citrea TaxID=53366 RepID=A0A8J3KFX2_9ACTN|nr:hypothetical protein Cci01nite_12770 [Catellatospora citrea]